MKPSLAMKRYLRLYFIMGSNNSLLDPLYVLEAGLKGGISLFQFREKGVGALIGQDKKALALEMHNLCKHYSVPFIVNDDVALALEIGAEGVHVGQDDMSVASIRTQSPEGFLIGVSATSVKEAEQAMADGADYIGVGPIYATSTKEDAKQPIGIEGIAAIRSVIGNLPMVAIGGIKQDHVGRILEAGADGVSVISAIGQAESPEDAAKGLRKLVNGV